LYLKYQKKIPGSPRGGRGTFSHTHPLRAHPPNAGGSSASSRLATALLMPDQSQEWKGVAMLRSKLVDKKPMKRVTVTPFRDRKVKGQGHQAA